MRKVQIVRSRASKNHMTSFEQLQHIKNVSKAIVLKFQQKLKPNK